MLGRVESSIFSGKMSEGIYSTLKPWMKKYEWKLIYASVLKYVCSSRHYHDLGECINEQTFKKIMLFMRDFWAQFIYPLRVNWINRKWTWVCTRDIRKRLISTKETQHQTSSHPNLGVQNIHLDV